MALLPGVGIGSNVLHLAGGGGAHFCAVKSDSTVICFGWVSFVVNGMSSDLLHIFSATMGKCSLNIKKSLQLNAYPGTDNLVRLFFQISVRCLRWRLIRP